MIHLHEVQADVEVDSQTMRSALQKVSAEGWEPAVTANEALFAQMAGIDVTERQLFAEVRRSGRTRYLRDWIWSDVFFREEGTFFVSNRAPSDDEDFGPPREALTVGGIGADADRLRELVTELCEILRQAITDSLDGRKARHLKFEWAAVTAPPAFEELFERLQDEGTQPRFGVAVLDPAEVDGAKVLSERGARTQLVELARSGFARTQDLLEKRAEQRPATESNLRALVDAGLTAFEYTLMCRGSSSPLTRAASREWLEEEAVANLRCTKCNRRFGDENVVEGHAITELGSKLLRGSHWMTVWVTKALVEMGVPLEAVRWNLEESGEEVDIIVDFLEELWVLELKDREFGAGDAYPFDYRRGRYEAKRALIVTTERISQDAKRVLRELGGNPRRTGRSEDPTFIEGLSSMDAVLGVQVQMAALTKASARVSDLRLPISANLERVVRERHSG